MTKKEAIEVLRDLSCEIDSDGTLYTMFDYVEKYLNMIDTISYSSTTPMYDGFVQDTNIKIPETTLSTNSGTFTKKEYEE